MTLLSYDAAVKDACCPCHGEWWLVKLKGAQAGQRKCRVRNRERNQVENMTPERREYNLARFRVENMTPEQVERRRAKNRVENMTPEQIAKRDEKNARNNARRVHVGQWYVGTVPTADQAADLNTQAREAFS